MIFALLQIFHKRNEQATIELILVIGGWILRRAATTFDPCPLSADKSVRDLLVA